MNDHLNNNSYKEYDFMSLHQEANSDIMKQVRQTDLTFRNITIHSGPRDWNYKPFVWK